MLITKLKAPKVNNSFEYNTKQSGQLGSLIYCDYKDNTKSGNRFEKGRNVCFVLCNHDYKYTTLHTVYTLQKTMLTTVK